jgi:DNA-binding MarR family transcriptional regulator
VTGSNLGSELRRAWLGYQLRIDEAMHREGFKRRYPDGRVLRLCSGTEAPTISAIGRELGISRQGAAKLVAGLSERGYVVVVPSQSDRRMKVVSVTPRARAYLNAIHSARRSIDGELRDSLGPEPIAALERLAAALSQGDRSRQDELWRRVQHAAIDTDDR